MCLACTPEPPLNKQQARLGMFGGTWYSREKGLYHTLYVQDSSHIGLDTHMDTVLFFAYKIVGDSLALYHKHGKLINYNRILKLTDDTLVFESLLDRGEPLGYSKKAPRPTQKQRAK